MGPLQIGFALIVFTSVFFLIYKTIGASSLGSQIAIILIGGLLSAVIFVAFNLLIRSLVGVRRASPTPFSPGPAPYAQRQPEKTKPEQKTKPEKGTRVAEATLENVKNREEENKVNKDLERQAAQKQQEVDKNKANESTLKKRVQEQSKELNQENDNVEETTKAVQNGEREVKTIQNLLEEKEKAQKVIDTKNVLIRNENTRRKQAAEKEFNLLNDRYKEELGALEVKLQVRLNEVNQYKNAQNILSSNASAKDKDAALKEARALYKVIRGREAEKKLDPNKLKNRAIKAWNEKTNQAFVASVKNIAQMQGINVDDVNIIKDERFQSLLVDVARKDTEIMGSYATELTDDQIRLYLTIDKPKEPKLGGVKTTLEEPPINLEGLRLDLKNAQGGLISAKADQAAAQAKALNSLNALRQLQAEQALQQKDALVALQQLEALEKQQALQKQGKQAALDKLAFETQQAAEQKKTAAQKKQAEEQAKIDAAAQAAQAQFAQQGQAASGAAGAAGARQ